MASEQIWFVKHRGNEQGPFSSKQLKQLAEAGKITSENEVRMGNDGDWLAAAKVKGLFGPLVEQTESAYSQRPQVPSSQAIAAVPSPVSTEIQDRAPCPFCGEIIASTAVKCRHCNEFLDGRPREYQQVPQHLMQAPAAPTQHVNVVVNQQTIVGTRKRWNALVAMFLSLIFPGLGQLYKGQLLNGLVWFIVVIIGYAALIVPGLVLHVCCVVGAGLGDPYR